MGNPKYTAEEKRQIIRRFKNFRKVNLLSQAELAVMLGLTDRSGISCIENGKRVPHRSTLKRFSLLEARSRTPELRREYIQRKDTNAGKSNRQASQWN